MEKMGAGLSDKELCCIGRHLRYFIETNWKHNENEPQACIECPYLNDCYPTGVCTYHWQAFSKLSELSGLRISPGIQG